MHIFDRLTPKFKFNSQSTDYMDCLGLLIFYYQFRGIDTSSLLTIPRKYTDYTTVVYHILSRDYKSGWVMDDDYINLTVLRYGDIGHLAVVIDSYVYHMSLDGIQKQRLTAGNQVYHIAIKDIKPQ